MIRELFATLGVDAKVMFASFWGGVVAVFFTKTAGAFAAIGLVVTGTFTGHYLGPHIASYIGLNDAGATGFLTGFLAMSVLQFVADKAKQKMSAAAPPLPTNGEPPHVP